NRPLTPRQHDRDEAQQRHGHRLSGYRVDHLGQERTPLGQDPLVPLPGERTVDILQGSCGQQDEDSQRDRQRGPGSQSSHAHGRTIEATSQRRQQCTVAQITCTCWPGEMATVVATHARPAQDPMTSGSNNVLNPSVIVRTRKAGTSRYPCISSIPERVSAFCFGGATAASAYS